MARAGKTAVVVGAGIGGLAAAAALAGRFDQVTVLERDILPKGPEPRDGAPQSRHDHMLLVGGLEALRRLAPGFDADLLEAGATPIRLGLDARTEQPGEITLPARDFGHSTFAASRPLYEFTLRRRVAALPGVTIRDVCRAGSLSISHGAVSGVAFEDTAGRDDDIAADLVVDASGAGTLTLAALKTLGLAEPETSFVGVDIGYSTAVFRQPADAPTDWKILAVGGPPPEGRRGALILPMEGDRWMAVVVGRGDDRPPGDWDGWMAFARGLPTPTLYDAVRGAEREGEPARIRFAGSIRRRFEALTDFPGGLVPLGDAICRFNPVAGQGMSVAAQEAVLLGDLLDEGGLANLGQRFFARARGIIDTPWGVVVNSDFQFPDTRGEAPPNLAQAVAFGRALRALAAEDPEVHRLWNEVFNLLRPASEYAEPALVTRVLAKMAEMSSAAAG